MLEYLVGGVIGGVVGWMAKARSCGTTPQNGGGGGGGGGGAMTLDGCDTAVKSFLDKLDPASRTALQTAIANADSVALEQTASIVQAANPQLATCLRNLKKA